MMKSDTAIQSVLCGATEAAAVAAAPWIGANDKIAADQAAVTAMEGVFSETNAMQCTVIIGEGVKDEAPMLPHGEVYGSHAFRHFDMAVDPVDGTTQVAYGHPGGIATAALAEPDSMLPWSDISYMMKLAVGPKAAELMDSGKVHLANDPAQNMEHVARSLDKHPSELRIAMLDRERNQEIMKAAERVGARVILLAGGDIIPAFKTALPGGDVDMLYGSGGAPEAVLAAAGMAGLEGGMQAMWHPQTKQEKDIARAAGQLGEVFDIPTLVGKGETHFALTAITPYEAMLDGCSKDESGIWQPGTTLYLARA